MENILFPLASSPQKELATPCRAACPIYTDVQGYVSLIAQKDFQAALELIEEANPLPAVCGRICSHPCESKCRRLQVDQALSIASLKRAASDLGKRKMTRLKPGKKRKEKVAVIGAGPSGLAASRDLALLGYGVTVFEKLPEPGGALRAGVPPYRLPKGVLAADIAEIERLGVTIKKGVEIGKDLSLEQLLREGYSSVLISVGLSRSKGLPIPGADLEGVMLALPFLQAVNFGQPVSVGRRVIVVGGGNVAIDVARSALRLGAEEVHLACLESKDEMPAFSWEIEEALEEGIKVHCSRGPKEIKAGHGKIEGLEHIECTSVFDSCGRFSPAFDEKNTGFIEGDTVIIAIGQDAELSFLRDSKIGLNERGQLQVDRLRQTTSLPGVFASGEVMTGPGAAIEAIASGKKAALLIDAYVRGVSLEEIEFAQLMPLAELPDETVGKIKKEKKSEMPKVALGKRLTNFDQVELGFPQETAWREAQRCLNCLAGAELIEEKCAACLTCERICPFEAAQVVRGKAEFALEKCQACGLCAADCPAEAISMRCFNDEMVMSRVDEALGKKGSKVLLFHCAYHPSEKEVDSKTASVEVLCPGRLDTNLILRVFEVGAAGILLSLCDDEECRFIKGEQRLKQRIAYTQKLLEEIGWGGNRLAFYHPSSEALAEVLAVVKREDDRK